MGCVASYIASLFVHLWYSPFKAKKGAAAPFFAARPSLPMPASPRILLPSKVICQITPLFVAKPKFLC